jgi:hypothetical protein
MAGNTEIPDKIKHLHVWNGSNYATINSFTSLVNRRFDPKEHFFVCIDKPTNPQQKISCFKNVLFMPEAERGDFKAFLALLKKAEHIYWHAMGLNWRTQAKLLARPGIMKKSCWVEWGADLYGWRRKGGHPLRDAIVNAVCGKWRRSVSCTVAIFETDGEVIKRQFGERMPVLYAGYCAVHAERTEALKPEKIEGDGLLHVLVGHSATPNCFHAEVLEKLARYRDEKIAVHIPLTYGDMEYAKVVENKALELFPAEKVFVLRDQMELEDYIKYLWGMDVGIFAVQRQIALGNIEQLLYMLKKVYMPADSVLGKYFTEKNAEYYPYEILGTETFEEFSRGVKATEPADCVVKYMSENSVAAQWKVVFTAAQALTK